MGKALTQPAANAHRLLGAALFGSCSMCFSEGISLLIDGVKDLVASLSDKALA